MSSKSRRLPRWAKVTGIFGIIVGVSALLAASLTFVTGLVFESEPEYVDSWNSAVEDVELSDLEDKNNYEYIEEEYVNSFTGRTETRKKKIRIVKEETETTTTEKPSKEFLKKLMLVPDWYGKWSVVNGVLALLFAGGYILSSVFLLTLRVKAPRFFSFIIVLSIVRNIMSISLGIVASIYWAGITIVLSLVGLIVDVVFLITIKTNDRSVYDQFGGEK